MFDVTALLRSVTSEPTQIKHMCVRTGDAHSLQRHLIPHYLSFAHKHSEAPTSCRLSAGHSCNASGRDGAICCHGHCGESNCELIFKQRGAVRCVGLMCVVVFVAEDPTLPSPESALS